MTDRYENIRKALAMGCEMVGRFAKHKFRHVAT